MPRPSALKCASCSMRCMSPVWTNWQTLLNWDEDGLGEREDAEEWGVMFAEDSEEEEEA